MGLDSRQYILYALSLVTSRKDVLMTVIGDLRISIDSTLFYLLKSVYLYKRWRKKQQLEIGMYMQRKMNEIEFRERKSTSFLPYTKNSWTKIHTICMGKNEQALRNKESTQLLQIYYYYVKLYVDSFTVYRIEPAEPAGFASLFSGLVQSGTGRP